MSSRRPLAPGGGLRYAPVGRGAQGETMDIIRCPRLARQTCRKMAESPFVALDTEFIRDRSYWAKLCLVQMASPDYVCALDPIAEPEVLAPLEDLLQDETTVKILHGCKQDLEIFFNLFGRVPRPVCDTQVVAMALGYGDQPGYGLLVKQILGKDVCKNERFTDWAQRPLSAAQVRYAESDVRPLCSLYLKLTDKLDRLRRRSWIEDEMATLCDPDNFVCRPEDAWKRLTLRRRDPRYLFIVVALARWREEQAQLRDIPRQHVCDDHIIQAVARAPNLSADLILGGGRMKSRRVPGGEVLEEMVEVAKRALREERPLPEIPKSDSSRHEVAPDLLSLLKALLKARAQSYNVAPRMIATVDELAVFALGRETRVLSGWRYDIFGHDALALRNGKIGVAWRNGGMEAVPVTAKASEK
ncbi:MAG: ribonuclease D [Alphaproteobacteria bacterium]|nr:ribonuclease D [Alphaproteobacteria bacterium]